MSTSAVRSARKEDRARYRCSECGWTTVKWVGRCGECQAWGTVGAAEATSTPRLRAVSPTTPARPISQVQPQAETARSSGIQELDRVLGGGLVPGAVLLLAGEPGVGKSTLLLEVAAQQARSGARTLYVSGEESTGQIRRRAERTGAVHDQLFLAAETDLAALLGHIDAVKPELLVVDSVQTVTSNEVEGVDGGVTQVRAVTASLVHLAKERNLPTLLVGHVTKDGGIAGPRALEHIVDVVLQFEGDRSSQLRLLRAVKNRYGPVDEIGCFEIGEEGMAEVADASGLFVSHHPQPISGTCVTVTIEGRRPMLAEVQALVDRSTLPQPRRAVSGLDPARLSMLVAVLQRRVGIDLAQCDIYTATVGGASIRTPVADLAAAMSIATAATGKIVPTGTIAIGEVGLAGELRRVPALNQRLSEAVRLGFTRAVVPADVGPSADSPQVPGMSIRACRDVAEALTALRIRPGD